MTAHLNRAGHLWLEVIKFWRLFILLEIEVLVRYLYGHFGLEAGLEISLQNCKLESQQCPARQIWIIG